VRTRAGVAASAAGRWDDAERWFEDALARAVAMSNEMEVADIRRLRARVLLDRGRPDDAAQADELLRRSLDDYVRFGMLTYAAEVERMLSAATYSRARP